MGSLFRSEEMCQAQLFLQSEAAYLCLADLGELGLVQFSDLNKDVSAFQRKFVNEVRRCDEMERKLRYVEKEVRAAEIPVVEGKDHVRAPAPREMIDLEATFEKIEVELKEVNQNYEVLRRNFLELTEHNQVLRNTDHFFVEAELYHHEHDTFVEESLGSVSQRFGHETLERTQDRNVQGHAQLGFLAGALHRERILCFEQMIWRICHGNVFLRYSDIEEPLKDPYTGDEVHKCVFIVFYQGEQLGVRIRKVCEGFRASLYTCPENARDRSEMAVGVATRLADLNMVLNEMEDHRTRLLYNAAQNLWNWFLKVQKLKAVYHTLNLFDFDVTRRALIGECWCPVKELGHIRRVLDFATARSGSTVPSIIDRVPTTGKLPTFHRTNKFTKGFQGIVDAFGVASYREVNPAPFTIITFPFIFAIMFGDAGHGLIMTLFALTLIWKERQIMAKNLDNEIFSTFFGGRYIVLLMGIFSIYTGFIYNDIFSKSLNIFGSSWNAAKMNYTKEQLNGDIKLTLDPHLAFKSAEPYPFGMDPIWQVATNKLNFLNPFKMRMSVILGVTHMFFGVNLSLVNHIGFRQPVRIIFEWIPQVLFLVSLFGYLLFLIVFKWFMYDSTLSHEAPSLIVVFIDIFLQFSPSKKPLYEHQFLVEKLLLLVALLCVPVMLLARPLITLLTIRLREKKKYNNDHRIEERRELVINEDVPNEGYQTDTSVAESKSSRDGIASVDLSDVFEGPEVSFEGTDHEGEGMADVFVLQAIHTIEYCLGCISNTASYLRLWALSLAHAELSEVLWNMGLQYGFHLTAPKQLSFNMSIWEFLLTLAETIGCAFPLFFLFVMWAVLTLSILLLMEGLSAFLHALRLHWVEFQNKFYSGDGYPFSPFSFATMGEQ